MQKLLQEIITKHGAVIFNGDGYSAAWHEEAEKRGLPNLKTCVDALPVLATPEVAELFDKYGVLSPRELQSRHDIYLEQYIKTVGTEAKLVLEMARTMIFPAAVRYQNELASTCTNLKQLGYTFDTDTLDEITKLVKGLQDSTVGARQVAGPSRRRPARRGQALLPRRAARHGQGPRVRRQAGRLRRRRPLAAADVSGNVVHQVR